MCGEIVEISGLWVWLWVSTYKWGLWVSAISHSSPSLPIFLPPSFLPHSSLFPSPQHFPTFFPYPSIPFSPISLSTYPSFHIHQIPTIFTLSYLQHYHLFFLSLKSDFGYPMMVYSHHFPFDHGMIYRGSYRYGF